MDDQKRALIGSPLRDKFKHAHKGLNKKMYMIDADCVLVSKYPPGIIAYVDIKRPKEPITFAEVIVYNTWANRVPVYIVEVYNIDDGQFIIFRYIGGDWRPNPCTVNLAHVADINDWQAFEQWELSIRALGPADKEQ